MRKTFLTIGTIIILLIIVSGALWITNNIKDGAIQKQMKANNIKITEKTKSKDEIADDTTVINGENSVITLTNGDDGHSFISRWHIFYNDTICWGRLKTADYKKQKEKAKSIISELEGVKTSNKNMAEDLNEIVETARKVSFKDDRDAMVKLHRLFHDLDIYFNSNYPDQETFGITQYKGNDI